MKTMKTYVLRLTHSLLILLFLASVSNAAEISFRELRRVHIPEAHQAVAVDSSSFYAIANRTIARYEKGTSKKIGEWSAPDGSNVLHLNSGTVLDGKLYCANSNWPKSPLKNSVEIYSTDTLTHVASRTFEISDGAINWIERHQDAWWIVFAFYDDEVHQTFLARYNNDWEETGRWSFPETVLKRFRPNSNSGGSFGPNGNLFVTGHDHAELYVLKVPEQPGELEYLSTVPAPIAGQGIAWDHSDIGTLYGIVRKSKEVVKMQLSNSEAYAELKQPVEWIRNENNPVLPPRKGEGTFDSTRCMNPWVVRSGNSYKLYYGGGNDHSRHTIGVATAAVDDVTQWERKGPLFKNGPAGSFDAIWCVLPHAVKMDDSRWHLYYTGNAGRGSGLSSFPGIGLASSQNGLDWTRHGETPVLAPSGEPGTPDAIGIAGGSVLKVTQPDGAQQWHFYYTGCPTTGVRHDLNQQKVICLAVSDDGINWEKKGAVMLRDPNRNYEDIAVAGPVVHQEKDGSFRMWYSAIGSRWGYYSICYAESADGIHWRRGKNEGDNLQLAPTGKGWEKQMVEYPTVIREGDKLRLFYCGDGYGRSGIGTAISK
ncbi:glycoside hydrolase family protein [Thalassoglobus polymorphus]|uniref:Glycosyl hydrolase family 32 N-terminal domain-containing protein n=1 Tax=Thalassoglobus polymorphus TaxID=2527994 RepID=A0A517QLW3_9PLAN|nr:hypothetical protein [Thalassoglobus polymorphus]QDT32628.1 hypothetical protein Mal48_18750 [Thalassoglobus polymorphus]